MPKSASLSSGLPLLPKDYFHQDTASPADGVPFYIHTIQKKEIAGARPRKMPGLNSFSCISKTAWVILSISDLCGNHSLKGKNVSFWGRKSTSAIIHF
jgi:hypothetical protein